MTSGGSFLPLFLLLLLSFPFTSLSFQLPPSSQLPLSSESSFSSSSSTSSLLYSSSSFPRSKSSFLSSSTFPFTFSNHKTCVRAVKVEKVEDYSTAQKAASFFVANFGDEEISSKQRIQLEREVIRDFVER